MRIALTLLLLASSARASGWHEYETKHFLVRTDLPRGKAEVLLQRLETLHLLELKAMVGEEVEIPGRLLVVALSDNATFRALSDAPDLAGFFTYSRFGEPTIVFPVDGFTADPELIAHEMAHYLSWYIYPRQPRWFSEGLAQFYQTIASYHESSTVPERGSHIVRAASTGGIGLVGYRSDGVAGQLFWATQVPVAHLLGWNGVEDQTRTGRDHFWSWALYHYLWNTHSKQFTRYQQSLGDGGDPDLAWRTAFPEYDPKAAGALEKLDAALLSYCKSGRYSFYKVSGEGDAAFRVRDLPPVEARLTLLGLRSSWPKDAKERAAALAEEVDAAAGEDPGNPMVRLALEEREKPAGAASRRAAAAARPGDWRGWLLLGMALTGPGDRVEQEAALRKAVELNPDNASAQNQLAWALVQAHRAREALPFANRAADLAPWSPAVLDTLANAANQLGKCPTALVLQRRAAAMDEGGSADAIHTALHGYEAQCGAGKAAP